MTRPASGTPEEFKGKRNNKTTVRRNMFATKIPQINEVFEATRYEDDIAPIIKQLVVIRILRGITQAEMATACGIRKAALSMVETGRKLPTLALLLRMAFVVGAKVELTGWMDKPIVDNRKDEEE